MKINTGRKGGFTLVESMIVVAIIGMLAAIAVPNFVEARRNAQMRTCIVNLQQIDGAVQRWASEQNKDDQQQVTYNDIRGYLRNLPVCPAGGKTFEDSYTISTVEARPVCQKRPLTHKLGQE
jgi:prepilin-type N-terminal cleavage/methylation domain-containing protein